MSRLRSNRAATGASRSVPGAIGNAIYDATGKRIREAPITLDELLVAESLS